MRYPAITSVLVGAWGTAVFSNDTSSDVRTDFRDYIADGLDPREATDRLMASYEPGSGGEDAADFWLGLALTQHRLGRLLPDVHRAAVEAARQEDLGRWEPEDREKRSRAVSKALGELDTPQPPAKQVRATPKYRTALLEGQHFLYEVDSTLRVLFRVHHVARQEYAYLTLLDWAEGDPLPTGDALLQARPKVAGGREVGFIVYGQQDPAKRITMLPEQRPPWQPPRMKLWPFRRVRWDMPPPDDVRRDYVAWRNLPRWFGRDGTVRDPRA